MAANTVLRQEVIVIDDSDDDINGNDPDRHHAAEAMLQGQQR